MKKQPSARPGGGAAKSGGGPANKKKKKPVKNDGEDGSGGGGGGAADGTGGKGGDNNSPRPRDVCFGKEVHPGTKDFRRVVKETAEKFNGDKYGPPIYKEMRTQLKGRKFYKMTKPAGGSDGGNGGGTWTEVERNELIDRLRHAYVKLTKK